MNFLQTVLLALLANPMVFQQAIIPQRGSSSVIIDLFAGRSAPAQGSPALHARRGKLKMPNWVRKLRRRRTADPGWPLPECRKAAGESGRLLAPKGAFAF
jgi:hypothetical protein